jgi:L-fuculose-phosphate aldolase
MNSCVLTAAIHRRFRAVGAALMRVNANNTHSGNMSLRDPRDADCFHVTASGSQCGDLSPQCIVSLRFSEPGRWDVRPSTEAGIHRRVLGLSGVRACVHSHSIAGIALSLESPEHPRLCASPDSPGHAAAELVFQPVDLSGAASIGPVPVGVYAHPVGSAEMEERIPRYLECHPVTIVQGHGPFARGESLEECLHRLSVLDASALLATALHRRGVRLDRIQASIRRRKEAAGLPAAWPPHAGGGPAGRPESDPAVLEDFSRWLAYMFDSGLGAFGTGSMSRRVSENEMVFCPMSAAPAGIDRPLLRLPLAGEGDASLGVRLHRSIYAHTPYTACMLTASPLATAEGMAVLAEGCGIGALTGESSGGGCSPERLPGVAPIDAEGRYLHGRLGVVGSSPLEPDALPDLIGRVLQRHRGCCIISGWGVLAAGQSSLEQAAHRVSSAERTARFRQEVHLNHRLFGGLSLEDWERSADAKA